MPVWGKRQLGCVLVGVSLLLLSVLTEATPVASTINDIILVLDNSGSMRKNDPAFLTKAAVKAFVQQVSDGVNAAIIIFDSDARLVVPLTPLSKRHSDAVLSGLEQIDYRGLLTNTPAAMERAIYELKLNSRPEAAKSIILLTDGIVDTGDSGKDAEASRWLREELATDAARHEIKFFGIALTSKADFQLLQSLAVTTGGDYFRAQQAAEITRIFERIRQLIGPPASIESSPKLESPADDPKEAPAFLTLEVMGKERVAAKPVEPIAAIAPPGPAEKSPPAAQKPTGSAFLPGSRLAWASVFGAVVMLVAATWMLAWRNRTPRSGRDSKPIASAEAVPSAYLHDLKGVTGKQRYALTQPVTVVGRVAPDPVENANSVVINDPAISRRHALIEYKHHSFWLTDQKSGNGTFVNGQPITDQIRLRHGDRIRFYQMEFEFELATAAAADETCLLNTNPV